MGEYKQIRLTGDLESLVWGC